MRILLTGSSGLIGSALVPFLKAQGHEVVRLNRVSGHPNTPAPSWDPGAGRISLNGAGRLDAVIHLAGENIARRWTAAVKSRVRTSRVDATRLLSETLTHLPQLPEVFISASATGYYGDCGEQVVDEQSPSGHGFLAELCRDWESATLPAAQRGIRVVNLRIGIVLAAQGGALGKMLPVFRSGFGGRLGNGRQDRGWIALADLLAVFQHLLATKSLAGPVNAVSPNPVTNAELTRTLGQAVRRPTIFPVPALAVKLLFGEMGEAALLAGCRVRPARLEQTGFAFQFPQLEGALHSINSTSSSPLREGSPGLCRPP